MTTLEKVLELKAKVKHLMNAEVSDAMRREGIIYKVNYGVPIPELKALAKPYFGDHELALELFREDIRECKLLASMIDDPELVTGEQLDEWADEFTNPEIVEQVCGNLFCKTEYALSRSIEWCLDDDELFQKAGLLIIARKASDPNVGVNLLQPYIGVIENMADTMTDTILSSMSFALREIAKRSPELCRMVLSAAQRMTQLDNELAAWLGNELIYELTEA
jgi:3-methyladenine DNA glycosylase AlkD